VLAVVVLTAVVGGMAWMLRSRPAPAPTHISAATPVLPLAAATAAIIEPSIPVPESPRPEAASEKAEERPAPPTAPLPEPLEDMVSRVIPAVVLVETPGGRGTGFFVAPDTLLTNVHVVAGNSSVTIRRSSGATDSARVTAMSSEFDIAVLRISNPDSHQAIIPIGSITKMRVGQEVIAIGSPLGTLQSTVTRGIVSAVRQSGAAMLVQTDAAVNPGNSGGPLLDRTGTAIGITTMSYAGRQGLNFAVAIDHAQAVLDGRMTSTSPVSAPNDFRSLSPEQPSSADLTRSGGGQLFERTIAQLAQRADGLDGRWRSFKGACYQGRIVGAFDREWYALFDPRAMQGVVVSGCAGSFADLQRGAQDVRDAVGAAEEAARQADVYPGTRRDILRRYRLDSLIR
jgi:S1-C subfamily serine protease